MYQIFLYKSLLNGLSGFNKLGVNANFGYSFLVRSPVNPFSYYATLW